MSEGQNTGKPPLDLTPALQAATERGAWLARLRRASLWALAFPYGLAAGCSLVGSVAWLLGWTEPWVWRCLRPVTYLFREAGAAATPLPWSAVALVGLPPLLLLFLGPVEFYLWRVERAWGTGTGAQEKEESRRPNPKGGARA